MQGWLAFVFISFVVLSLFKLWWKSYQIFHWNVIMIYNYVNGRYPPSPHSHKESCSSLSANRYAVFPQEITSPGVAVDCKQSEPNLVLKLCRYSHEQVLVGAADLLAMYIVSNKALLYGHKRSRCQCWNRTTWLGSQKSDQVFLLYTSVNNCIIVYTFEYLSKHLLLV